MYGVIGDPIGHSLSPHIHNAALAAAGINAVYVPFRVPPDDLQQFIEDAPKLGIKGLSVTIPHKEAIAACRPRVDPAAKGIAAVNTLLFRDGQLLGYNTDCKAAMDSMEAALGEVGANPSPLAGKRALVLGAGGVSRAILYGLKKRGVRTLIASRTRSRADQLAKEFDAKAIEWSTPRPGRGRYPDQRHADRHAPQRGRVAGRASRSSSPRCSSSTPSTTPSQPC